jgi:hypothetical protein
VDVSSLPGLVQRRGQIVFALAKFFRSLVTIEMLTGFLSLTHPEEISAYVTAWEQLLSIAVRGRAARALIRDALAALDGPASLGNAH